MIEQHFVNAIEDKINSLSFPVQVFVGGEPIKATNPCVDVRMLLVQDSSLSTFGTPVWDVTVSILVKSNTKDELFSIVNLLQDLGKQDIADVRYISLLENKYTIQDTHSVVDILYLVKTKVNPWVRR